MKLIDLHVDWLLQYTDETVVFDASLYPGVKSRQPQLTGYLQGCSAAVLSCFRRKEDWSAQTDASAALDQLLTRHEAEFPGRLLTGPEDYFRWREDTSDLTWGLVGVEGLDPLIREGADLGLVARLVRRGVRLFQPVYNETSVLAGSSVEGDDRGLTSLGAAFLQHLFDAAKHERTLVILDVAHLNQRATSEVLDWFESDATRAEVLIPAYSHGTLAHPDFSTERALSSANLVRLIELGGYVGVSVSPPFFQRLDQLKQVVDQILELRTSQRSGSQALGIGTDFMGVDQTLPGLGNIAEVIDWFQKSYPKSVSKAILRDNAQQLITRCVGSALPV